MYLDVADLNEFYATRLGIATGLMLEKKLRRAWPSVAGERVLGLGYCPPFLKGFLSEAERVVAFMPAQQGVMHWPRGKPNLTALTEETRLPVPDAMFDRVLVAHALENTEQLRDLMREVWRVMAPQGRLLMIVPNRRGLWSRNDRTPFGWGHPYSRGQLKWLLDESMLAPISWQRSLYLPPMYSGLGIRAIAAMERVGDAWLRRFAGINMVEAEKRVYAKPGTKAPATVKKLKPILVPSPVPAGVATRSPQDTIGHSPS
jgi:SAM-dependent methyltransferase